MDNSNEILYKYLDTERKPISEMIHELNDVMRKNWELKNSPRYALSEVTPISKNRLYVEYRRIKDIGWS